ncbi:MAG: NAD(+)/NADH kinase [Steroidobacteraceae bacterium]
MPDIRRCALITRFADARVAESAALLSEHLGRRGISVLAPAEEASRLTGLNAEFLSDDELTRRADLVVAIGGDGTLLYAAGLVAPRGTPLLGVNRGRLGFLTDVNPEEMLASVDAALEGQCQRDQRPLLMAELQGPTGARSVGLALNDVVLQTSQSGRLIDFDTFINGRYVNSHGGDGLVVASSTGSTAYALSCGGPIVEPDLDVVVVAPICPHTLADRPIVVSARSSIEIRLGNRPDPLAEVACDGRPLGRLYPNCALTVRAAPERITLLHPPGYDFFKLLRSKLNWGRRSFDAEP